MSSASQATLGTLIRCKDGKAKTGTAVDAGNFLVPCRQRQNALSCVVFEKDGDVNISSFIKAFHKTNDIPLR